MHHERQQQDHLRSECTDSTRNGHGRRNKSFHDHCAMYPKSEKVCARLKAAFDNALRMARLAVEGSIIIVNVWDIGKQTSKEPNLNAVRKEKSLAHTPTRTSS